MLQKEMLEFVLSELKLFYNASPGKKSIAKMNDLFRRFKILEFDKKDIINYIDFCYKRMKKTVKNVEKRAGVDYFVAIVASDKTMKSYFDFLRAKGDMVKDNPVESEEEDDSIIKMNGNVYQRIMIEEDRVIYFCPAIIRFLIKDFSEMIPKVHTLSFYNNAYPEKKITMDTVKKHMRKEWLPCRT
jgi:hypothetical protein